LTSIGLACRTWPLHKLLCAFAKSLGLGPHVFALVSQTESHCADAAQTPETPGVRVKLFFIAFTPLLFVAAFAARYLSANVIVFQGGVVR
jgi:hypothetical protein